MEGFLAFALTVATISAIFGIVGLGVNAQWGYGGMLNIGNVAGFGAGMYTTTLLTVGAPGERDFYAYGASLPLWLAIICGGFVASIVAAAIATPALKAGVSALRLGLVTFAGAEILRTVLAVRLDIANGFPGVHGVGSGFRHWAFDNGGQDFYDLLIFLIASAVFITAFALLEIWRRAPFGRVVRAIREDSDAAAMLGHNVLKFQVQTFAIGGFFTGIAGGIYVIWLGTVTPDNMLPAVSFMVMIAVILGGSGNNWGVLFGIIITLGLLEQGSRFLPTTDDIREIMPYLRRMALAAALILVLRFRPQGVLPEQRSVTVK